MTVSSKHAKCNQVPSIISGSYSSCFYSTINFGSNHSGSSLHLNITNDVSIASLDKDRVSSFTCLCLPPTLTVPDRVRFLTV